MQPHEATIALVEDAYRRGFAAAVAIVEGAQIQSSALGPLHYAGWREGIDTALERLEAASHTQEKEAKP